MPTEPPRPPRQTAAPWYRNLTIVSMASLALGMLLGPIGHALTFPGEAAFTSALEAIARGWTNALRLVVVPLVTSQLFAAIAGRPGGRHQAGRLGLVTPMVFTSLLVMVAIGTVALVSPLMQLPVFQAIAPTVGSAAAPAPAAGGEGPEWIDGFIPSNLFAAAAADNLIALMICAIVFACAASRLNEADRAPLTALAQSIANACFVIVDWIVLVTPVAVFALAYRMSSGDDLTIGGMLLAYVGVELTALTAGLAMLYAVVVLTGSAPLGRFARTAGAAQLAAVTTRSSLATVPPLMRDAQATLGIPAEVVAYVLPLAGAMLKVSRAVTSPTKLVFLAAVVGLDLTWLQTATAVGLLLLQSPTTTGVARVTSGARSLPIYVAVGIPGEYALLVGTATAVTDWLMTLVNTTSYLSATALVARWLGVPTAASAAESMAARAPLAATGSVGVPVHGRESI